MGLVAPNPTASLRSAHEAPCTIWYMSPVMLLENVQQSAAINILSDPGYQPGPKIIPNACLVRLNWGLTDGRTGHNILYCQYSGTPALSNTVAQTIFAGISTGGTWTALAAFLAPTATLQGVTLLDVRSSTGTEFSSTGTAVPGTSTGTALPDEVAVCVTLRTSTRGPSGRGRFYIPGWASTATAAGGVVAATAVTAVNNWANTGLAASISSAIGPMVLGLPARAAYTSPVTGRQFPARAATTLPITSVAVKDNHWDSQRRRGLR